MQPQPTMDSFFARSPQKQPMQKTTHVVQPTIMETTTATAAPTSAATSPAAAVPSKAKVTPPPVSKSVSSPVSSDLDAWESELNQTLYSQGHGNGTGKATSISTLSLPFDVEDDDESRSFFHSILTPIPAPPTSAQTKMNGNVNASSSNGFKINYAALDAFIDEVEAIVEKELQHIQANATSTNTSTAMQM